MDINRRTFMTLTLAGAALGLTAEGGQAAPTEKATPHSASQAAPQHAHLPPPPMTKKGDMYYRPLGRTGEQVSILGLGGAHLGAIPDEKTAIAILRRAVDNGLTFMDNCWDYHKGVSEMRMGKALEDGYRDKVFLMTKIDGRDRKTAMSQLEESLRRLRTDRVDLMQVHEVIRFEDPDRVFDDDGAIHALTEAKQAGKIRYIGFTGHKDPQIHLRMLEAAKLHGFRFDAVQMPLNVMDAHFRSFEREVLPRLVEDGIGVLGMKSLGHAYILKSKTVPAEDCLRYSLSLPVATVITGIDSEQILDQALRVAKGFTPLDAGQMQALADRTRQAAMSGKFELFKTSTRFDGTAQNPEWLGPKEEA